MKRILAALLILTLIGSAFSVLAEEFEEETTGIEAEEAAPADDLSMELQEEKPEPDSEL